jgi:hypothetical protein
MQHLDAGGNALWASNGIVVCDAAGDQNAPVLTSDGIGGVILTWNDQRSGRDIYAQRVDAGGAVLWPANGAIICNAANDQYGQQIITDNNGGAIITWSDSRGSDPDIYAQHVSPGGTTGWTTNGVVVCAATDWQGSPILVTDGAGGAIITWSDSRAGGFITHYYAQHISAAGTATWTSNGIAVCTAGGSRGSLTMITNNAGGAILCWEDYRNGNGDIYIQQLDAGGIPALANNGQTLNALSNNEDSPVMTADGAGGGFIAWVDDRAGFYLYAQHIDASGTGTWASGGIPISTIQSTWIAPAITMDGSGGAIVVFSNPSYNFQAQRIDAAGNALWPATGTEVTTGDVQDYPFVLPGVPGGAIVYFPQYRSGDYNVYAQNVCSGGSVGGAPAPSSAIAGSAAACNGLSSTYSVTAVSGVNYTWTLPSGWSGTSTGNTISVTPEAAGGTLSVNASNSCGTSAAQSLTVTITPVVASPDSVVGASLACSGLATTYSVAAVSGATGYVWTLPSGWSGTSATNTISVVPASAGGTITAAAANMCGASTAVQKTVSLNSVPSVLGIFGAPRMCAASTYTYNTTLQSGSNVTFNWVLPSGWASAVSSNSVTVTPGSTGSISVSASNACGSSSTLTSSAITVDAGIPADPDTLFGATTVCYGTAHSYSITAMSNVWYNSWGVPAGWSSNGAVNPRIFTANGPSGTITVSRVNACGTSATFSLPVTVVTIPQVPVISGSQSVCAGSSQVYTITADTNATSYTWNVPSGWGGISATDSISLTAGSAGGMITATASNSCGTSATGSVSVTVRNAAPAAPALIDGPTTVCSGTSVSYSVAPVTEADTYTWSLPSAWAGNSSTNTLTAISNGNGTISMYAANSCGSSDTIVLSVAADSIPLAPATILGNASVCEGSTNAYTITPISNADSYDWIVPAGWTGTSTDDLLLVSMNAASGSLQVSAVNACGASDTILLNITVNTFPLVSTTQNDTSITAVQSGATYQWFDCNNGNAIIAGANAQSYTATVNGNYAVAITTNGCVDTSACVTIAAIGLKAFAHDELQLNIFPNPNNGSFIISTATAGTYTITNALGQIVRTVELNVGNNYKASLEGLNSGVYYVNGNNTKHKIVITE